MSHRQRPVRARPKNSFADMGLFNAKDFATEADGGFAQPTDTCFYCGEPLDGEDWIYWHGIADKDQQIWMHPKCAKRLSDHLSKDWNRFVTNNPQLFTKGV